MGNAARGATLRKCKVHKAYHQWNSRECGHISRWQDLVYAARESDDFGIWMRDITSGRTTKLSIA